MIIFVAIYRLKIRNFRNEEEECGWDAFSPEDNLALRISDDLRKFDDSLGQKGVRTSQWIISK